MLDAFAAANVPEHHVLFGKAVRRDHHRDGLPDGLVGGVAEQLLCAAIPGGDDAVEILADDRIVRRLDDRRKSECRIGRANGHCTNQLAKEQR